MAGGDPAGSLLFYGGLILIFVGAVVMIVAKWRSIGQQEFQGKLMLGGMVPVIIGFVLLFQGMQRMI